MKHIREQELAFARNSTISIEDPAFDQFNLFIDFGAPAGLFAPERFKNSALAYLQRIGEQALYESLKSAIDTLSTIQRDLEYRLIHIEGVDALLRESTDIGVPKPIRAVFRETIDWDLRHALLAIRRSMYDDARQLWILPENLRRFSCILYFRDYRLLSGEEYIRRYGYDASSVGGGYDQYQLGIGEINEAFKNQPALTEPIQLTDTQHIAITMPVCEILMPTLNLQANKLDINTVEEGLEINVLRSQLSMLHMQKGPIELASQLNPLQDPKAYLKVLQKQVENKISIAMLAKIQELRDKAVSKALNTVEQVMQSNVITRKLSSFIKPNDFWSGIDSVQFKQGYSQYADDLDSHRQ